MPDASSAASATHRLHLSILDADPEITIAQLWAAGALGIWERPDHLVAWFHTKPALPGDLAAAAQWSLEPDRDWQEVWKATIEPVRAGRVAVVPSWLKAEHEPEPDEVTIILDPGRAFGSGHHATTLMCLELLDDALAHTRPGAAVADIGCGTGILAIAAAKLGARPVAVDIDPDAVEVTRDNARRNDVELDARVGSIDVLDGPADVVVANLVTDVIVTLATELVTASRQTLVVSGIASTRREAATSALEAAGATVVEARERDGWVALRARTGR